MKGCLAPVAAACIALAALRPAFAADPFLEQGLRPAACIVTDGRMESFLAVRGTLEDRGVRALHAFPPDVIFGRFPGDLTESALSPFPVSIVRSPDAAALSMLNPVTRRVIRGLFDERGFLEEAERVPRGMIRDVVITEPATIGGGERPVGPLRGSPMEVTERGFRQNSEFMIGSILVNVVFPESAGEGEEWTDEEIGEALSGIALGVTEYQKKAKWAAIDFTYNYEEYIRVPISMEPIEVGNWKSTDTLWIREAMDYLGYGDEDTYWLMVHGLNNATRARFGTEWVLTAFVIDMSNHYPGCWENAFYIAYAAFGGPFLVVPHPACEWGYGAAFAGVFIHEMSHNFYALDEYEGGNTCAEYAGYLAVQNRNALTDSCQATVPCIMRGDLLSTPFPVCDYTMGQIGLADDNLNTIPDIYEVSPGIEFIEIPGVTADTIIEDSYLMAVRLRNQAVPNQNPYQLQKFPERMIDYAPRLVNGWFAVNHGPFRELQPSDGVWDGSREDIGFFTEELEPGMNIITVRTVNCYGLEAEGEIEVCYVGIKYYEISADVTEDRINIGWKTADDVFGAAFDIMREDLTGGGAFLVIATVDSCTSSGGGQKYFSYPDEAVEAGHDYRYRIVGRFELGVGGSVRSFEFPSEDIYKTANLPVGGKLASHLMPNPMSSYTVFTVEIPKAYRSLAGRAAAAGDDGGPPWTDGAPSSPALVEAMTFVDVTVYDVTGRRIVTIYSRSRFGGYKTFRWDGVDAQGAPVPPGVYFIRVSAGDETAVRKVVVIR